MGNPLIDERLVDLLLHDVLDVPALCRLPFFSDHSRDTFAMYLESCRRFAREELLPSYRPMDEEPPRFENGRIVLHPLMRELYPKMVELGVLTATRPAEVGGHQLPLTVATLAHAYLMAGNLSATGLAWLTNGAAHLIEAFGDDRAKALFLEPMYEGRWTGTMALTEPHAGSSLADLTTKAIPVDDGTHRTYRIRGAKIFISGSDHDVTENVVNLTLARIEDAPPGTKGVSLFAVPRLRPEGGTLVPNDVEVTGMIHKIGWKGLPSLALAFGERGDCRGWLIGEQHRGLAQMFQMMNEARIQVGVNGVATASVAFHEAVAYAQERKQGRSLRTRDPSRPPIAIVEHPDVRRMLLRQKSIVDAGLAIVATASHYADLAAHDPSQADAAKRLLDLLTPIAKTFPAEWGFEANALAVQVHGGYGYSSEYPVEAWLRDQKLNTIHEGTTGIQALDLLGRKAMGDGGVALRLLGEAIAADAARSKRAGVDPELGNALCQAMARIGDVTLRLARFGAAGDLESMSLHSTDYLMMMSIVVAAWQHLRLHTAANHRLARADQREFANGLVQSAKYWFATELPLVEPLAHRCDPAERSYFDMRPEWF